MAKKTNVSRPNDLEQVIAEIRTAFQRRRNKKKVKRKSRYKYEPSLISYLDILGMKDLLNQSGQDANKIAEVLERFRYYSNPEKDMKKLWKMSFVNFSDLGIRTVPILTEANLKHRLGCFFHEIWDLGYIQANLISRGWLVRGALTIGQICNGGGLLFGPGLVDAYLLESKEVVYPRIVVSDLAMEALEKAPVLRAQGNSFAEEMSYMSNFLRKDSDGKWFINHLAQMQTESDTPMQYAIFLGAHRDLIERQRTEVKGLPRGDYQHSRLKKLKWLINLHRAHLKETDAKIFLQQTGIELQSFRVKRWASVTNDVLMPYRKS
jgi:hypothetical protein